MTDAGPLKSYDLHGECSGDSINGSGFELERDARDIAR
jgi:hypothetical protein